MKKIKIVLILLGMFCTLSGYTQEEFFGNNTGLSVVGSTDLSNLSGGGLSLHFKNGVILSGSFANLDYTNLKSINIGYIMRNKNDKKSTNGIIGLSYGDFSNGYSIAAINMGLNQILLSKSNFPFSFTESASISSLLGTNSFENFSLGIILGYTQSFFVDNPVYPVIGVTYSSLINQSYYSNKEGSFLFHVGLNIKLSKN